MRRFDKRPLPAFMLMAACLCSSGFVSAQSPAVTPSDSAQKPAPPESVPKPAAPAATSATLPKTPATFEQVGDALMAHQRYQAAIEAYKKAPPDDAAVWNKLGIAYQLMFNLTDAMHCYKTSYKLNPKNSTVLNNLGTVYDALKEYHNAEKMYRKALKIDPGSALILKNLGTNLLAQHKFAKGWAEYQAALKVDPLIFEDNSRPRIENPASISDRGAMNFYLAKGCVRAGMPLRAIEYLRMALNEGYTSPKKIIADNEFAALHGLPEFEELLNSQTQKRQ
ncbi:MAG TPA: tetratricopeptide repeat protein [Terracidiphilus sp.]|nr:tetratricopeptide repeat protein [Terracidiphilus sp.]